MVNIRSKRTENKSKSFVTEKATMLHYRKGNGHFLSSGLHQIQTEVIFSMSAFQQKHSLLSVFQQILSILYYTVSL